MSRLKRANKIIGLPPKIDNEFFSNLNKNQNFIVLSVTVRSQIRRALKLLNEYNEYKSY